MVAPGFQVGVRHGCPGQRVTAPDPDGELAGCHQPGQLRQRLRGPVGGIRAAVAAPAPAGRGTLRA